MDGLEELAGKYRAYVDGYRGPDGRLPDMMQLKLTHTMMVVAAAIVGSPLNSNVPPFIVNVLSFESVKFLIDASPPFRLKFSAALLFASLLFVITPLSIFS